MWWVCAAFESRLQSKQTIVYLHIPQKSKDPSQHNVHEPFPRGSGQRVALSQVAIASYRKASWLARAFKGDERLGESDDFWLRAPKDHHESLKALQFWSSDTRRDLMRTANLETRNVLDVKSTFPNATLTSFSAFEKLALMSVHSPPIQDVRGGDVSSHVKT